MPVRSSTRRVLGVTPPPVGPERPSAPRRLGVPFGPRDGSLPSSRNAGPGSWLSVRSRGAIPHTGPEDTSGDPTTVGSVTSGVDLPDPPLRVKEQGGGYGLGRFTGPLFVNGPSAEDVRQGSIGDCYFMAVLGAVAHTDGAQIEKVIKDNGDGTYTCRFFEKGTHEPAEVKIDADLWVRSNGAPLYASAVEHRTDAKKMELWVALVQKGYAAWKGGFEKMGNGGKKTRVLEELYGHKAKFAKVANNTDNQIYNTLKKNTDNGWPAVVSTYGNSAPESARYNNIRLSAHHCYSVLGVSKVDGQRYVHLRNPWGSTEPGNDGKNDGIFKMKLEEVMYYFSELAWICTNSSSAD